MAKDTVNSKLVMELRNQTGLGMMECKQILVETRGNMDEAVKVAASRGVRQRDVNPQCGIIECYMHHDARLAALVELNCETDFAARTDVMRRTAKSLALHIAGRVPMASYSRKEDVPRSVFEEILASVNGTHPDKPEAIREKIAEGKFAAWCKDNVLLDQPLVQDGAKTVCSLVTEAAAQTKENVRIGRFSRWKIGPEA